MHDVYRAETTKLFICCTHADLSFLVSVVSLEMPRKRGALGAAEWAATTLEGLDPGVLAHMLGQRRLERLCHSQGSLQTPQTVVEPHMPQQAQNNTSSKGWKAVYSGSRNACTETDGLLNHSHSIVEWGDWWVAGLTV